MKAKENSFESVVSGEMELVIPFFQREYVWENEH